VFWPVQWGFPAGFDVPIYSLGSELWPDRDVPKVDVPERWPERPQTLRTVFELADECELRPRNEVRPDG
jgi:hypothetical protein